MEKLWIILILIIFVFILAFEIVIAVQYGNKPVGEIPAWVLIFLIKR